MVKKQKLLTTTEDYMIHIMKIMEMQKQLENINVESSDEYNAFAINLARKIIKMFGRQNIMM